MRVLALSAWWPEPANNGIRLRIAHLLRTLAGEHEVHLVALSQGDVSEDQRRALARVCASARATPERAAVPGPAAALASLWRPEPASVRATWNPAFARLVQDRAEVVRPDLVVAFELSTAPYARALCGVPKILEALEVAPILEQYTSRNHGWRRWRAALTWHKHRSYLARTLRDFDACTVVSARELAHVQALASPSTKLAVISNGADVAGCAGPWGQPEPDTLVYPGALSYSANFDAMAYFVSSIFPQVRAARPGARLRITGNHDHQPCAALPQVDGVEFTGYVPDVRPVVASAWCEVVPLRVGGGTRLKVLEALALGTPVIATSKGVEGLELERDRHVLVADTPGEFAAATTRLLGDADLRARLADAGRQAVRAQYDWRAIGRRLNELIDEMSARGTARG